MADLSLSNVFALACLGSIVWYFFDAMRARETATAVVREYCKQSNLQFLDGTVGLRSVTPVWSGGRLRLRRRYEFHYSESDHSRGIGLLTLVGDQVESFILPGNSELLATERLEA